VFTPSRIELVDAALELEAEVVSPFQGHPWEQVSLPLKCRGEKNPLLVSFSGIGPVAYGNKVLTIHDVAFLPHPEWFSRSYATLYRLLFGRSARNSRHIITVSEFSKGEIVRYLDIPEDKITVIPSAVKEGFTPGEVDRELLRLKGIDRPFILGLGSLEPRKNFRGLLEAYSLLAGKTNREVDLVIAGGSYQAFRDAGLDLEDVRGPGRVILPGYLDDREVVNLYRAAELFAFPSLYEGFGLPPLEAMACGTPVLAAGRASIPEVCGDAALYCEPEDPESISSGMSALLEDEELIGDMKKKGKGRASLYSFDETARRVDQLVREMEQ
jgi:glycosyltransferase involved in cell wall biosynthesis